MHVPAVDAYQRACVRLHANQTPGRFLAVLHIVTFTFIRLRLAFIRVSVLSFNVFNFSKIN